MAFDRSNPCETHYRAKLVLRILCLLFSLVGIATSGYAWYICIFLFVPFGLSLLWNLTNIIRRLTARTPVHPGANVGLDLIIWLFFFGIIIFTYLYASAALFVAKSGNVNSSTISGSYIGTYIGGGSTTQSCVYEDDEPHCTTTSSNGTPISINAGDLKTRSSVALASCVFGTGAFLLHFILFVFACVDTHRRRHPDRYPAYQVNGKSAQYSYPQTQQAYVPANQQPMYQ
ncbi:MAG: hypothetical protein LQ340_000890 [Diploschistes diacapsis]|nr:MAG: hypothetical protein LQ340_000890 [Diploschistes diacapsis]